MLGLFNKKKKPEQDQSKVVVIGIDGVPCSLLNRLTADGTMPNLAELSRRGTLTEMTASIPEVSSTSWSTFMTGVNPGRHGIYGFMELGNNSYQWKFPNSNDMKSETLWEIAGRNNLKSVVLNVPSTYPAKELNGVLTAGFVALDLKKATYPDSAYDYLNSIGYIMDVDAQKAQESLSALADEIDKTFEVRKKAINHFFDNSDWQLFISVITETDRLHHYLWVALDDDNHPQHDFFIRFYKKIDDFIGSIYDRVGDSTPFLMLSDHGFTSVRKEIYLNSWLREQGYLSFINESPRSMEEMHEKSQVFALDPSRLYIHLKGKYPKGSVAEQDYEKVRQKVKSELLGLSVDGVNVIKDVLYKEELYIGDQINDAPDLVVLSYEGFDLKGAINKKEISGTGFLTGGHTREDAFFYINRKITESDINIVDVAPTISSLLNINHNTFDGRELI